MKKRNFFERMNDIAVSYISLSKIDVSKFSTTEKLKYNVKRNEYFNQLAGMIEHRNKRYSAFTNYEDLNQVGREGLIHALNTYDSTRGTYFYWWAKKYINTRVSRAASQHSVIRVPIAYGKDLKPQQVDVEMVILNTDDPHTLLTRAEKNLALEKAVNQLNPVGKKIIEMFFGINGIDQYNLTMVANKLNMSRNRVERIYRKSIMRLNEIFEDS